MRAVIVLASLLAIASNSFAAIRNEDYELQEKLFKRVVASSECHQVSNSTYCEYKLDNILSFAIKDVGGRYPQVVFRYSNVNEELFAAFEFGCVAIFPGANPPHDKTAIYISLKDGRPYRTSEECEEVKKQTK